MTNPKNNNTGFAKKIALGSGLIIIGLYAQFRSEDFMQFSGLDNETTNMLSIVLIMAGIADIITFTFLSRLREKR